LGHLTRNQNIHELLQCLRFYRVYSLEFGHGSGLPPITFDIDCVLLVLVVELIEVVEAGTQYTGIISTLIR
jgi:hypothetical protein